MKRVLFPLSGTSYWYIQVYAALMIVSPFLNIAIENMSRRHFTRHVLLLVGFNCISLFMTNNMVNNAGYSIFNFICCYLCGACLRCWEAEIRAIGTLKIIIFMVLMALGEILFIQTGISLSEMLWFNYSSPYVIMMSACFMILFDRIEIRSKVVNIIGAATIGVYLIHTDYLGAVIFPYIRSLNGYSLGVVIVRLLMVFLCIWIGGIVLNILKQNVFTSLCHIFKKNGNDWFGEKINSLVKCALWIQRK